MDISEEAEKIRRRSGAPPRSIGCAFSVFTRREHFGYIVNPVELAASGRGIRMRLSICVGIGKGAAGGKTSAPAVEDALHRQQLPMLGHAHRQRPSSRGLDPLPFTALCDVAFVDALLYATGRVAVLVLVGRLPVARPRLLTNEALGGGARNRGQSYDMSARRLSTGENLSPVSVRASRRFVELSTKRGPGLLSKTSRFPSGCREQKWCL